jgi:general secretion pathway protein N
MQLGGLIRLVSPGLSLRSVQGRWLVDGRADVELLGVSSRLVPLDNLGSYRLSLRADPTNAGQSLLTLSTQEGALQLSGNGSWGPGGVRFRGEARAASDDTVLTNLLNIIGRRDGARSLISIG